MKKSSIYSQGKEFLSFIRKGDFAHAGEEEAIELTLQDYDKNPSRQILDIGCGLGGTAQYIQTQGWGKVYGIDIEQDAIDYAENKYSDIEFQTCSANDIDKKFSANQFDLIMIFNAFFCCREPAASEEGCNACGGCEWEHDWYREPACSNYR